MAVVGERELRKEDVTSKSRAVQFAGDTGDRGTEEGGEGEEDEAFSVVVDVEEEVVEVS